ncbi:ROK family protein [Aeromicrobium marinum DSM 15272]|uniref:Glucokinase n=1 Tax=Aeromicrobium marinum DSM 15272 TaxID=585531 RepID=E2SAL8_9ACTN|nr:ROK family glucokinase [Aeromicrobium marinum]EFQ83414.1 ROK family protein [Aeromicrobium marinum DSM 15272]
MADKLAIGIDIGGTKIAAGVVDEDGLILARVRRDTPTTDAAEVLDAITEIATELRADHLVRSIGIGAAGFIDASQSTVLFSPHLAWRNEPLRDRVSRRTGLPVLVDNDANASGWAEWRFGAAQNEPDVVAITLGTGIGGALVIDGQPYRGGHGIAGEFGHMQVEPDGRPCECGNRGCWEQYASGRVLSRRAAAEVGGGSPLGRRLVELAVGEGLAPHQVDGTHVTRLARAGDATAREWIAEVGQWLGVGIANLAAALDPGIFVIGGGVSDADDLLLLPARAAYSAALTGRGYRAEARVVKAHLGADAGLVGAADMARITARRRRPAHPAARARVRAAARSGRSPRRRR